MRKLSYRREKTGMDMELLRSESRSCCTDVDVTSGGLIPCAGHGKFRSETASSEVEEHHGLNLSLSNLLVLM